MHDPEYLYREAHIRPNSTAAIAIQAIGNARWKRQHERKQAFKQFFAKLFSKKA